MTIGLHAAQKPFSQLIARLGLILVLMQLKVQVLVLILVGEDLGMSHFQVLIQKFSKGGLFNLLLLLTRFNSHLLALLGLLFLALVNELQLDVALGVVFVLQLD